MQKRRFERGHAGFADAHARAVQDHVLPVHAVYVRQIDDRTAVRQEKGGTQFSSYFAEAFAHLCRASAAQIEDGVLPVLEHIENIAVASFSTWFFTAIV